MEELFINLSSALIQNRDYKSVLEKNLAENLKVQKEVTVEFL